MSMKIYEICLYIQHIENNISRAYKKSPQKSKKITFYVQTSFLQNYLSSLSS